MDEYITLLHENQVLKDRLAAADSWVKAYQRKVCELENMDDKQGQYLIAEILMKIERGQGIPLRVLEKPTKDEVSPPKGIIYMIKSDLEQVKYLLNHEHWDDKEPEDWDSEDEDESTYEELKHMANKVCTDN